MARKFTKKALVFASEQTYGVDAIAAAQYRINYAVFLFGWRITRHCWRSWQRKVRS